MTDAIDIFSKKSIKEIQDAKEKEQKEVDEAFNSSVKSLLESYLTLCEDNELTSIVIGGTTKGGIVKPRAIYKEAEGVHKLQFVIEECKLDIHEHCAEMYGLREFEFIEE